jgi:hypothetical protein
MAIADIYAWLCISNASVRTLSKTEVVTVQKNMEIGLGIVAIALIIAAGALVAMRLLTPYTPPPPIEGYVNVQVINGATKTNLTLTQLLQMSTITGTAMYENIVHNWKGYGIYQGVLLSAIIATVGTMSNFKAVRVNATDGYTQLYSYDNLYPNATFRNIQGDAILAFACNGTRPPAWTIGPRIVFLPPDGNYSNTDASSTTPSGWYGGSGGSRWVYNVSTIELLPNIVVKDGSTKLNLALPQLLQMSGVSGYAEFQNQYDNWRSYGSYAGVNLSAIIETVGTMGANDVVRVNSTDGYSQLYSYDNLYPNSTFGNIQGSLIVAYSYNGTLAPTWSDGLRIVFLPPDHQYSNVDANTTTPSAWFPSGSSAGTRWLKYVATIELLHGGYPPSHHDSSSRQTDDGNGCQVTQAPASNRAVPVSSAIEPWLVPSPSGFASPTKTENSGFRLREDN